MKERVADLPSVARKTRERGDLTVCRDASGRDPTDDAINAKVIGMTLDVGHCRAQASLVGWGEFARPKDCRPNRHPQMKTSDFDYDLPAELIAAYPALRRDASRLLVLDRDTGGKDGIEHRVFADLAGLLREGDCLVMNDSRVIPARLAGRLASGGRAEVLLTEPTGEGRWQAMVRPGKKLGPGRSVIIENAADKAVGEVRIEEDLSGPERIVRIVSEMAEEEFLDEYGHVPLPPYILAARRQTSSDTSVPDNAGADAEDAGDEALDRERYQTIYAEAPGSVAAPTAGLHFTSQLLDRLKRRGVELRYVTLHVGPGTFAPVKTEEIAEHRMHRERFSIESEEAAAIGRALDDPERRIVAVGTTATRVLEACLAERGRIEPGPGTTDIFITPGFEFRAVDALITNFHLPRSTLLMLVCAFAGRERTMRAYAEAVADQYRFYSYGDAMLIR